MTDDDGNEWKVITKNDKKCIGGSGRRTNRGRRGRAKQQQHLYAVAHGDSSGSTEQSKLSVVQIIQIITNCKKQLEKSHFWINLKDKLLPLDDDDDAEQQQEDDGTSEHRQHQSRRHQRRQVKEIVCYGIGNFITTTSSPSYSAPLWQLACALLIRDIFSTCQYQHQQQQQAQQHQHVDDDVIMIETYYYDPCMTNEEANVLEMLHIKIIPINERGKRVMDSKNNLNSSGASTSTTFFFMPHCPMNLYTNLLYTNWYNLNQVIMFGNNLVSYTNRLESKPSTGVQILKLLLPYIEQHEIILSKEDVNNAANGGYFENAFNDSCIITFTSSGTVGDSDDDKRKCWPTKPIFDEQDVEEDSNNQEVL